MAKEELITLEGLVTELLPDARFRVQLDTGHTIVAYTAGRMKKHRIKTLAGDRVTVEMSPYDLEKGRLVFRHKDERAATATPKQCRAARSAAAERRIPVPWVGCRRAVPATRVWRWSKRQECEAERHVPHCDSQGDGKDVPAPLRLVRPVVTVLSAGLGEPGRRRPVEGISENEHLHFPLLAIAI